MYLISPSPQGVDQDNICGFGGTNYTSSVVNEKCQKHIPSVVGGSICESRGDNGEEGEGEDDDG
jgi:hypothetical protein